MPAQGSHKAGFLAALAWIGVESWVILGFLIGKFCYIFNSFLDNKYTGYRNIWHYKILF
jgi:hypothetical protein